MGKSVFNTPVFLSASARTPIGKFGGSLKPFSAPQLAAAALKESIRRSPHTQSSTVILGHARQAGTGPNPARQCAIAANLPETTVAWTVNQACASGLASVIAAVDRIQSGKLTAAWAGGVESMSNTPYFLSQARWGYRLGNHEVVDGMRKDGFFCPMADMLMGETVEHFIAKELNISRREQDEFAVESQRRAEAAWNQGLFAAETFSIDLGPKHAAFQTDEHRRAQTTLESLAKLPPAFDKAGSVTAGNSSGITDGAAFVSVSTDASHAEAEILDYEMIACDPKRMGLGPVPATLQLLKRHNLEASDLEAVELNEAFAAQVIACQRVLKIPPDTLNARGGAIALGHPIGATGTRMLVTLIHRLKGSPGALGLATLCVSGGMGVSVLIRSVR